jgi:hypothetical protein
MLSDNFTVSVINQHSRGCVGPHTQVSLVG